MSSNRNIVYFFRNLRRKHRLSYRDEHDDNEVWYMHISPIEILGGFVALILVLFIIILTTIAYTPVLNLIPGYSGNQTRETLIQNIMRVDSIERVLNEIQIYSSDVALIMDGKTPVIRNVEQQGDTIRVNKPENVVPSSLDTVLREQMEGTGIYGLNTSSGRNTRSSLDLLTPVRGIITSSFSPRDGHYGLGMAIGSTQQIVAVADGTVVLNTWTPEDGNIIQIQHANNLISVYKNVYQSLKQTGNRVRGGEVVAYSGDGSSDDANSLFIFELWLNGSPVDPENYIVF